MSLKYRIRLADNRVIGPLTTEEVAELFLKNHINGSEDCQLFPVGDWKNIRLFKNLEPLLTPAAPPSDKSFQEFKFEKVEQDAIDYFELEKKYEELEKKAPPAPKHEATPIQDDYIEETFDELDKTVIQNPNQVYEIEKTVIDLKRSKIPIKENTEIKQKRAREEAEALERENQQVVKSHAELVNDKTQFLDLKAALPSLNTELRAAEVDFDQKEQMEENQELARIKERDREQIAQIKTKKTQQETKKSKVGMKPIVAIAFLAIIYVLLYPDEAPKSVEPLYAPINFPITMEFEDASQANLALQKGKQAYMTNTYQGRVLAVKYFTDSMQLQFRNNEALGELVLTATELIENAKNEQQAANTIYKLILLSENKTFSDVKVVTGTALYFYKIGKFNAGINLVKNFFRAKGKPSAKLYSYYLELLIAGGDFPEATKTAIKLNELEKKPYEAYITLAHYFEVDEKIDQAEAVLDQGLKVYPNNVALLLRRADFYFKNQSIVKIEDILKKCKKLNLELSPAYTAQYFKHMGYMMAAKNKNKEAAAYFRKSLSIRESDDLRSVLASLEVNGDKFSQSLILESKIMALMKKADAELKNKNYESASALSVEATDADPDYVPAVLQHVKIQTQKGLFDAALFSLNRILNKYPQNMQIRKMLIETNLKALKLDEAQRGLVEVSKTKFGFSATFASLMGQFFYAKKLYPLAIRWHQQALTRDPISELDMFLLSQIFFKTKKFEEAKSNLTKAQTLNPKNTEYVALRAEILAEQDNADVAIGYLRDALDDYGEDSILIATIAKIYYSSGQLKEFQNYYKKVLAMPKKDEHFFEFLIQASKIEDNKEDFIAYSKELLKINPGNLALEMEMAEFYIRNNNLTEAKAHLVNIEDKLKSYPRLHYFLSKIALFQCDVVKAQEMAEKEKEYNPTMELSYIMMGEVAKTKRDWKEALLHYEKALSINPKSVDALIAMGVIKREQNHTSEALDLLLQANKYDRTNPEISKQLGFAYRAVGQRLQGKEYFENYLKLNPGAQDRDQIEAVIRSLK